MLPRPYAPIIPLGRGPCGHVSKAWREGEEEEGGRKRERGGDGGEVKGERELRNYFKGEPLHQA